MGPGGEGGPGRTRGEEDSTQFSFIMENFLCCAGVPGRMGPDGEQGPQGENGTDGDPGAKGEVGESGLDGTGGRRGYPGLPVSYPREGGLGAKGQVGGGATLVYL